MQMRNLAFRGLRLPRLGAMRSGGQEALFTPASLFAGSIAGAWYGPSDLSTLFQDSAGTTPVTTAGQPVGLMLDKSGRANHAVQATAASRPTYQTGPARATLDKVDDRLSVTVPVGGFTGTMVLGTDQGTASYGVTIPAGAYDIGGRYGQYFPGTAIVGQVIRNGALSEGEAAATEAYFVENGATASYGAVTDFNSFWRNFSELTSFPLIDTSAGTSFFQAWRGCDSLTSFPLIDTSAGTNFYAAWYDCTSLTSFPLIDTSAGTDFRYVWYNCDSLTSFPLIDTSAGTEFRYAWYNCDSLTSFPLIDTSAGIKFERAWRNCSGLTTIPAGLFDNIKGGDFTEAFTNTALTQTSIDNVLVSLVASGISTGTRVFDQSGGSAPSATGEAAIDTLRSRGWTVTVTGGYSPASLSALFAGGQEGLLLEAFDIDTLFQVSDGTTPVTVATNPIGYFGDKSGRANHAVQATAAARPTYQTDPARATLDKVDDRLSVTVPTGGFTGTMVLGTDQGTASYGVTIPAGAYDIGGRHFPGNAIVGQLIRDGALSAGDAAATEAYFVENGATAGYGSVTDFSSYWREWSEITSFPLIDTSSGTSFNSAWSDCTSLTSFPLIDTSSGTSFQAAWRFCTILTSFPLIDTSSGTTFNQTWRDCRSLTSFPLIDTSAGTDFSYAWYKCNNLTSFPANAFDNVSGGDFTAAFLSTRLTQTSIDNILVSLVASGIAAGTRVFDQSGGSAPSSTGEAAIDTLRSRGWTVTVTGGY